MSDKSQITTLVFDWDGTLVDSAQLGFIAFERTFKELGLDFPIAAYEAHYSPNWYSTYQALKLSEELWDTADAIWLKHYGEQTAKLFDGVGETLTALHAKGYQLGVVTSGTEVRVKREMELSAVNGLFDVLVCNEDIVNKKPDPEGLEIALRRLERDASNAAYVGDAPEDIEMGRRGKVFTIGVKSNYPSSARLIDSRPDLYLESVCDLTRYF